MQYGACRDRELQSAMNSLYTVECLYGNRIRILEGIHRMHFLGQDLCADLLACKTNDSGLYRIAVRCRQVRDRDLQSPSASMEADSLRFGTWYSSSSPICSVSIWLSTSVASW